MATWPATLPWLRLVSLRRQTKSPNRVANTFSSVSTQSGMDVEITALLLYYYQRRKKMKRKEKKNG